MDDQDRFEDDAALVRGIEAGDPEALPALVRRFNRSLMAQAMHRGFSYEDAEELAIDTFEEFHRTLASYQRDRPLRRWLGGILWNLMRRRWSEQERAVDAVSLERLQEAGKQIAERTPEDDPKRAHEHARRLMAYKVESALLDIEHPRLMDAVRLRYLYKLEYDEVAGALGLKSAASARVYVQRGLKLLREKMSQTPPEEGG